MVTSGAGCPCSCQALPTWTRLHQSGGSSGRPQGASSTCMPPKRCSAPHGFTVGRPEPLAALVGVGPTYPEQLTALQMPSARHKHNLREDMHLPPSPSCEFGKQLYPGCPDTPSAATTSCLGMPQQSESLLPTAPCLELEGFSKQHAFAQRYLEHFRQPRRHREEQALKRFLRYLPNLIRSAVTASPSITVLA